MEHLSKQLINWASILEPKTREQALATASMPFVYPHVALMPDAHLGKGATVGSVIPTLKAIIPAAVGVDIGCGMIAVRTQFTRDDVVTFSTPLATLRQAIEHAIPLSAGAANQKLTATARPRVELLAKKAAEAGFEPGSYARKWDVQLGTLGSGNHFIEVTVDEMDRVWLFLHSGSRGVGNRIAQYHIGVARELCERWWIRLPDRDLAYLPEDTDEFWHYIRELRWAQEFALLNREEMMDRVIGCVADWFGTEVVEHERINCHHNFTQLETYCPTCTDIQGSDSRLLERLSADETVSTVRDFLAGCRPSVHSCGGLLLLEAGGARVSVAVRADVLAQRGIALVAQTLGLAPSRTRSGSYDLCECDAPSHTDASSSTFSSKFGRDFCRHVAIGKEHRRLGTALDRIFFGVVPRTECNPAHEPVDVWLSRKGAIEAKAGQPGLIPGSMGTASYVVVGKGNPLSLNSSPHGAGRNYSRSAARRTFNSDQLRAAMKGIEYRDTDAFIDEIPQAYKPIDQVMADAADLVEVRHVLRQLVNVKGD